MNYLAQGQLLYLIVVVLAICIAWDRSKRPKKKLVRNKKIKHV